MLRNKSIGILRTPNGKKPELRLQFMLRLSPSGESRLHRRPGMDGD